MMIALMGVGLILFLRCFESSFKWEILTACAYISLELIVVTSFTMFFAAIVVTPVLSGLFAFGVFLAGRSIGYIGELKELIKTESGQTVLNVLEKVLPHLEKLNVADQIVYSVAIPFEHFAYGLFYALTYSTVVLIIASLIFSRREFV